jgi:HPt (histidine-containing phosphotransfer) domain-containing protein
MTKDPDGKIEALLADIWQRNLPILRERLDLLDRTAAKASAGTLDEASRLEALSISHKLAGNLGMFGHHQAAESASEIEHILKSPTPETLAHFPAIAAQLRQTLASSL